MSEGVEVRNYTAADFDAVKAIHESTQIDYKFPNIASPLFLVKKVLTLDGIIRVAAGTYIQTETYLWMDASDWTDPAGKMAALRALNKEVMLDTWLQGVDEAVLWLPPGYESFGKRLVELGFHKDRDGWISYSRKLTEKTV